MSWFKRLLPRKVKTKVLAVLGVLITVMIVVPVVQIYNSTIKNALVNSETGLRSSIIQIRDKLISDNLEQLTLIGVSVASMPSVQDNVQFQSRSDLLDTTRPLLEQLQKTMEIDAFSFFLHRQRHYFGYTTLKSTMMMFLAVLEWLSKQTRISSRLWVSRREMKG